MQFNTQQVQHSTLISVPEVLPAQRDDQILSLRSHSNRPFLKKHFGTHPSEIATVCH